MEIRQEWKPIWLLYYGTMAEKTDKRLYLLHITVSCNECRVVFLSCFCTFFHSGVVFLCFHPCLISVLLQVHLYIWLIFPKTFHPTCSFCCFLGGAWQQATMPQTRSQGVDFSLAKCRFLSTSFSHLCKWCVWPMECAADDDAFVCGQSWCRRSVISATLSSWSSITACSFVQFLLIIPYEIDHGVVMLLEFSIQGLYFF